MSMQQGQEPQPPARIYTGSADLLPLLVKGYRDAQLQIDTLIRQRDAATTQLYNALQAAKSRAGGSQAQDPALSAKLQAQQLELKSAADELTRVRNELAKVTSERDRLTRTVTEAKIQLQSINGANQISGDRTIELAEQLEAAKEQTEIRDKQIDELRVKIKEQDVKIAFLTSELTRVQVLDVARDTKNEAAEFADAIKAEYPLTNDVAQLHVQRTRLLGENRGLTESVSQLKHELNMLTERTAIMLNDTKKDRQNEIDRLDAEIKSLRSQLDSRDSQHKAEVSRLNAQIAQANTDASKARQELNAKLLELAKDEAAKVLMETRNGTVAMQLKDEELALAKRKYALLEDKLRLESDLSKRAAVVTSKDGAQVVVNPDVAALNLRIKDLELQVEEAQQKVRIKELEFAKFKSSQDKTQLETKVAELEAKLSVAESKNSVLENNLKLEKSRQQPMEDERKKLTEEHKAITERLNATIERLKGELAEEKAGRKRDAEADERLSTKIQKLEETHKLELATKALEHNNLKAQLDTVKAQLEAVQKAAKPDVTQKEIYELQLKTLQTQLDSERTKNSNAKQTRQITKLNENAEVKRREDAVKLREDQVNAQLENMRLLAENFRIRKEAEVEAAKRELERLKDDHRLEMQRLESGIQQREASVELERQKILAAEAKVSLAAVQKMKDEAERMQDELLKDQTRSVIATQLKLEQERHEVTRSALSNAQSELKMLKDQLELRLQQRLATERLEMQRRQAEYDKQEQSHQKNLAERDKTLIELQTKIAMLEAEKAGSDLIKREAEIIRLKASIDTMLAEKQRMENEHKRELELFAARLKLITNSDTYNAEDEDVSLDRGEAGAIRRRFASVNQLRMNQGPLEYIVNAITELYALMLSPATPPSKGKGGDGRFIWEDFGEDNTPLTGVTLKELLEDNQGRLQTRADMLQRIINALRDAHVYATQVVGRLELIPSIARPMLLAKAPVPLVARLKWIHDNLTNANDGIFPVYGKLLEVVGDAYPAVHKLQDGREPVAKMATPLEKASGIAGTLRAVTELRGQLDQLAGTQDGSNDAVAMIQGVLRTVKRTRDVVVNTWNAMSAHSLPTELVQVEQSAVPAEDDAKNSARMESEQPILVQPDQRTYELKTLEEMTRKIQARAKSFVTHSKNIESTANLVYERSVSAGKALGLVLTPPDEPPRGVMALQESTSLLEQIYNHAKTHRDVVTKQIKDIRAAAIGVYLQEAELTADRSPDIEIERLIDKVCERLTKTGSEFQALGKVLTDRAAAISDQVLPPVEVKVGEAPVVRQLQYAATVLGGYVDSLVKAVTDESAAIRKLTEDKSMEDGPLVGRLTIARVNVGWMRDRVDKTLQLIGDAYQRYASKPPPTDVAYVAMHEVARLYVNEMKNLDAAANAASDGMVAYLQETDPTMVNVAKSTLHETLAERWAHTENRAGLYRSACRGAYAPLLRLANVDVQQARAEGVNELVRVQELSLLATAALDKYTRLTGGLDTSKNTLVALQQKLTGEVKIDNDASVASVIASRVAGISAAYDIRLRQLESVYAQLGALQLLVTGVEPVADVVSDVYSRVETRTVATLQARRQQQALMDDAIRTVRTLNDRLPPARQRLLVDSTLTSLALGVQLLASEYERRAVSLVELDGSSRRVLRLLVPNSLVNEDVDVVDRLNQTMGPITDQLSRFRDALLKSVAAHVESINEGLGREVAEQLRRRYAIFAADANASLAGLLADYRDFAGGVVRSLDVSMQYSGLLARMVDFMLQANAAFGVVMQEAFMAKRFDDEHPLSVTTRMAAAEAVVGVQTAMRDQHANPAYQAKVLAIVGGMLDELLSDDERKLVEGAIPRDGMSESQYQRARVVFSTQLLVRMNKEGGVQDAMDEFLTTLQLGSVIRRVGVFQLVQRMSGGMDPVLAARADDSMEKYVARLIRDSQPLSGVLERAARFVNPQVDEALFTDNPLIKLTDQLSRIAVRSLELWGETSDVVAQYRSRVDVDVGRVSKGLDAILARLRVDKHDETRKLLATLSSGAYEGTLRITGLAIETMAEKRRKVRETVESLAEMKLRERTGQIKALQGVVAALEGGNVATEVGREIRRLEDAHAQFRFRQTADAVGKGTGMLMAHAMAEWTQTMFQVLELLANPQLHEYRSDSGEKGTRLVVRAPVESTHFPRDWKTMWSEHSQQMAASLNFVGQIVGMTETVWVSDENRSLGTPYDSTEAFFYRVRSLVLRHAATMSTEPIVGVEEAKRMTPEEKSNAVSNMMKASFGGLYAEIARRYGEMIRKFGQDARSVSATQRTLATAVHALSPTISPVDLEKKTIAQLASDVYKAARALADKQDDPDDDVAGGGLDILRDIPAAQLRSIAVHGVFPDNPERLLAFVHLVRMVQGAINDKVSLMREIPLSGQISAARLAKVQVAAVAMWGRMLEHVPPPRQEILVQSKRRAVPLTGARFETLGRTYSYTASAQQDEKSDDDLVDWPLVQRSVAEAEGLMGRVQLLMQNRFGADDNVDSPWDSVSLDEKKGVEQDFARANTMLSAVQDALRLKQNSILVVDRHRTLTYRLDDAVRSCVELLAGLLQKLEEVYERFADTWRAYKASIGEPESDGSTGDDTEIEQVNPPPLLPIQQILDQARVRLPDKIENSGEIAEAEDAIRAVAAAASDLDNHYGLLLTNAGYSAVENALTYLRDAAGARRLRITDVISDDAVRRQFSWVVVAWVMRGMAAAESSEDAMYRRSTELLSIAGKNWFDRYRIDDSGFVLAADRAAAPVPRSLPRESDARPYPFFRLQ